MARGAVVAPCLPLSPEYCSWLPFSLSPFAPASHSPIVLLPGPWLLLTFISSTTLTPPLVPCLSLFPGVSHSPSGVSILSAVSQASPQGVASLFIPLATGAAVAVGMLLPVTN